MNIICAFRTRFWTVEPTGALYDAIPVRHDDFLTFKRIAETRTIVDSRNLSRRCAFFFFFLYSKNAENRLLQWQRVTAYTGRTAMAASISNSYLSMRARDTRFIIKIIIGRLVYLRCLHSARNSSFSVTISPTRVLSE